MSCVTIFGFDKDGNSYEIADVQNAWLGAMAIWKHMSEKYLKENFSLFNPRPTWRLYSNDDVNRVDKIVLGSTFDMIVVKKENFKELIESFRSFEGETSLKEQAEIIEKNKDKTEYIAFHQNSISCDMWFDYNIFESEEHSFLFDDKQLKK